MGLLDSVFGGGGSQTVSNKPWGPTHPYFTGGTVGGQQVPIYGEGPKGRRQIVGYEEQGGTEIPGILPEAASAYQGAMEGGPVGLDPSQMQGFDMMSQYAQSPELQGMLGSAMQGNQFLASGDVLSPDSNPYLSEVAGAYADTVGENLNRNILPQIGQNFTGAGQGWNSSREGIESGLARGEAAESVAQNTARLYSDAYGRGLNAMQSGISMAPQTAQAGAYPGQLMSDVGSQFRQQDLYEQQFPFQQLGQYSGVINQAAGQGGQTVTPQSSGGMLGALGGASAGAGLASTLGMSTPWGAGLGALAGLLG